LALHDLEGPRDILASPARASAALRWQVKEREATGIAAGGARYHVELDPSTHRFEVTFFTDDDRGLLLPADGSSIEAAIIIAEQDYARRRSPGLPGGIRPRGRPLGIRRE
jgi:hypothetical protein